MKINLSCSLLIITISSALFLDASAPTIEIKESGNGLPNPSINSGLEFGNFDLFASLIVWTAREAGSDCWAEVITTEGSASSNVLRPVHFDWDPGFKVGVGYGIKESRWDTQAYYTWYNTCGKDSVSSAPGTVHSTFTGNFYVDNAHGSGISGPAYQKASIDWGIHFNIFDWELGHNFYISKALDLRPFLGAKGGWIYQSIDTKWYNPDLSTLQFLGSPYYSVGTEKVNNNFWGLGPQAGINTKWLLFAKQGQSFNIIGDFSGAMMWGHWSFGDVFQNTIGQEVFVDFASLNNGATMMKSFLGFGFDTYFRKNRFHLSLKLGYEAQFWLDQLQFYSFVGGRLVNTLTLQGGTLEFCLDY